MKAKRLYEALFKFNLNEVLDGAFETVQYQEDDKIQSIEYEAELNELILEYFNKIKIRIGSAHKKIDSKIPLILTLYSDTPISKPQAEIIVNFVAGLMNESEDYWRESDWTHIENGIWAGRTIIDDNKLVSIEFEDGVISLCITGCNAFIV